MQVPDGPKPDYAVYTYDPNLCDKFLSQFVNDDLPKVYCTQCNTKFTQLSITEYHAFDESIFPGVYADLQFHQYGGLCLTCRAPYPGEGHFEQRHVHDGIARNENPLKEYLNDVQLDVPGLQDIVWHYCKPQVLPAYPELEDRHQYRMWGEEHEGEEEDLEFIHEDLVGLYEVVGAGLAYMSVPGVEHVYFREGTTSRITEWGAEKVNIKLDYRYWRPKECKCTQIPCECICIPAQVHNIVEKLNIPNDNNVHKILGTFFGASSFFVSLRAAYKSPYDLLHGTCQTEEGVHTPACTRRNTGYESFQCMTNEGRCGRCADCKGY
jgi:hypothetical protein